MQQLGANKISCVVSRLQLGCTQQPFSIGLKTFLPGQTIKIEQLKLKYNYIISYSSSVILICSSIYIT